MAQFSLKNTDLNDFLKETKNKSYFVVAITVLFLVTFILVGVIPAYSAVFSQIRQNKARDTAISKLSTKLQTLVSLDTQLAEKQVVVDYLNKILPSGNDQKEVVKKAFDLSAKEHVSIRNISFSDDKGKTPITAYFKVTSQIDYHTASITLEGSRVGLIDYVKDIENSRIVFNIQSLQLSKKSASELLQTGVRGDHVLKINLQYFFLDNTKKVPNNTITRVTAQ